VQTILRALAERRPLEDIDVQPDTDVENAARVAERRNWPVADLINELERDGDEVQELLGKLTPEDAVVNLGGMSMSLSQFLRMVKEERHDIEHLGQLEPAGP
jgi:hypothetical protein